jgi:NAD kinase
LKNTKSRYTQIDIFSLCLNFMTIKIGNKIVYYRSDTKNLQNIESFIDSDTFQNLVKSIDEEVIFVLGWDGTMLWAIDEFADKNIPFYGINLWNKWFLLNDKSLISNMYIKKEYPLLEWTLKYKWKERKVLACNEFDIRTENGRVIDVSIQLDNSLEINFSWDGIVVSTPLWSSGYNSSLWWPILPHESNLWIISPKAPWKPKDFPHFLYSLDKKIVISRKSFVWPIWIYRDGRYIESIDKQEDFSLALQKKEKWFTLIISDTYKETWINKIYIEQGFRNLI